MAQWEYKTVTADVRPENGGDEDSAGLAADRLDAIAAEGWELVSAFPISGHRSAGRATATDGIHYIFRRQKQESDTVTVGMWTGSTSDDEPRRP